MVKSSSRPKIMAKIKIHFAVELKGEKLPSGPMSVPRPGPTFPKDDAAAERAVIKSRSVKARAAEIAAKEKP